MPRLAVGPILADGTGEVYLPAFRTYKPVRIRNAVLFASVAISGGTNLTGQLGYSPSGAEIVASATHTISTLDSEEVLTIANAVVPAGKVVVWKQTATSRTAGKYWLLLDWDDDY